MVIEMPTIHCSVGHLCKIAKRMNGGMTEFGVQSSRDETKMISGSNWWYFAIKKPFFEL